MSMWMSVTCLWVPKEARGGSDFVELELQVVVRLARMLVTKLWSPARIESTPEC